MAKSYLECQALFLKKEMVEVQFYKTFHNQEEALTVLINCKSNFCNKKKYEKDGYEIDSWIKLFAIYSNCTLSKDQECKLE